MGILREQEFIGVAIDAKIKLMTDQNINPNDNYPEETPQGDFNEISAFQDEEGAIELVNADGEVVPIPEEVTQCSPDANGKVKSIGTVINAILA